MARYTWERRNQLAAQRLQMLGITEDQIRNPETGRVASPYQTEKRLGLNSLDRRAEWARQHDWFYRGTVGTVSRPGGDDRGENDTEDMARDYVRGFLYRGRETPARKAARDRFVSRMGGPGYVDWKIWRDFRLGPDTNVSILDEAPEEWEIYENE